MRFFVPHASNSDETLRVEAAVRKFVAKQCGEVSSRQIFRIRFRDKKQLARAEVGKKCSINQEEITLILYDELRNLYLICTRSRGVGSGAPILIGGHEIFAHADFDKTESDPNLKGISDDDIVPSISAQLNKYYYAVKCIECDRPLYLCEASTSDVNSEKTARARFLGKAVKCSFCKSIIPVDSSGLTFYQIR